LLLLLHSLLLLPLQLLLLLLHPLQLLAAVVPPSAAVSRTALGAALAAHQDHPDRDYSLNK
jgi:hypothetical protein